MFSLGNVSNIAVGSSQNIWALDADDATQLYRYNALTGRYEGVTSNIDIRSMDVSLDGLLVALDTSGAVYLWDDATSQFVARQTSVTPPEFEQIFIGDGSLWAVSGSELYQWSDADSAFESVYEGVKAFAVGKADDVPVLVDGSGNLRKFNNTTAEWDIQTSNLGGATIVQMAASSDSRIWARDSDGKLWQFNPYDFSDNSEPDSLGASLVAKSTELGIPNLDITHFALDDKGLLYGVQNGGVILRDAEAVSIQTEIGERTQAANLTTDTFGTLHLVYSTEGGVYHSYQRNGNWIDADVILNSAQASEIEVDTDAEGNVYATWIQDVGNDAEVWTAKGIRNEHYGGYIWSAASQVTDDTAGDKSLNMAVSSTGHVTFSTHKIDQLSRHDDHDIYHYSLDGSGHHYRFPDRPAVTDDLTEIVEVDPLGNFVDQSTLLGGPDLTFGIKFRPEGLDYKGEAFNGVVEYQIYGVIGDSQTGESNKITESVVANIGINFAKLMPTSAQLFVPDIKVSATGTGSVVKTLLEKGSTPSFETDGKAVADLGFTLSVNLLAFFPDIQEVLEVLKDIGVSLEFGLFGQQDLKISYEQTIFEGLTDSAPINVFPPTTLIDTDGNPVSFETPPGDLRAVASLEEYLEYLIQLVFPNANLDFLNDLSALEDGTDLDALEGSGFLSGINEEDLFTGIYGKAAFDSKADFLSPLFSEAKLQLGTNLTWEDWKLQKLTQRDVLDVELGKLSLRVFDLQFTILDESAEVPLTAIGASVADYNHGGTTAVYDLSAQLLGVDENGNSDILDSEGFNYVLLDDNRAFGVYIHEVTGVQSETGWDVLQTIDGVFDTETGVINWDETTTTEVSGSLGLNITPKIATVGDEELVVAYGNVDSDNEDLIAVTTTPPGKAYILYGGSGTNSTLDLSDLDATPTDTGAGFYFTNDQSFFGIGGSATHLHDIDGNGKADFAFGAPDANNEAGRVYVVFAETVTDVDDIDALGGTLGFTFSGIEDYEVGYAIADAGDFTGDGVHDIAISAPGAENHQGVIYVLSGANDWTQNDGVFTVADIGGILDGQILIGPDGGERWGTALAGGKDLTGDAIADLAVGSMDSGQVTVVSRNGTEATIDYNADSSSTQNPSDFNLDDIGSSLAVLPDINRDGHADLALGSNAGTAYVVFGGSNLALYNDNYVTSVVMDNGTRVVLTLNGEDKNGDGILSGASNTAANELTVFQMEVFNAEGQRKFISNLEAEFSQGAFDLNFDLATENVLINASGGETDVDNGVYGLRVGVFGAPDSVELSSDASTDTLDISGSGASGSRSGLSNTVFQEVSTAGVFDLQNISDVPTSGFEMTVETALPLTVADAGDVNGDGHRDVIAGFDASTDGSGNPVNGRSYVLYANGDLGQLPDALSLDALTSEQGFVITEAGGKVSAAGRINDDKYGDLLVSSPGDSTLSDQGGSTYVIYGAETGSGGVGLTITDSNDRERSGSALTQLGDINDDGFGDFLVGAPHAVNSANLFDARDAAELTFVTRSLTGGGGWSDDALVDGEIEGLAPAAIGETSQGTLLTWIEPVIDSEGNGTGQRLMGSFYSEETWSGDASGAGNTAQVIHQSTNEISEVAIADTPLPNNGDLVPTVAWVERDINNSGSTTVNQIYYLPTIPGWQNTPTEVSPVIASQPIYTPGTTAEALVSGTESLSVEDVHVKETDGQAVFTIKRSGDLSRESVLYSFRIKDAHAQHSIDYSGEHMGTFSFAAGEDTHEVGLTIHVDGQLEGIHEDLRIEITSAHPEAQLYHSGLAINGDPILTATMTIEDTDNSVLPLASIDSGFQIDGEVGTGLGAVINRAGDVNGDDVPDVLVAATRAGDNNEGAVYLINGGAGIELGDLDLSTLAPPASAGEPGSRVLNGTVENGFAGTALAASAFREDLFAIGAPGTTAPDSQGHVYVRWGDFSASQSEVDLDGTNFLSIGLGEDSSADGFGRALLFANLESNSPGVTSLLVGSNTAVYLINGIAGQGTTGEVTLDGFTDVVTITDSELDGLDAKFQLFDFDGDGHQDLIIGVKNGNVLLDENGSDRGEGGYVAVIRGSANGISGDIDLANLGDRGFRLMGQAEFTPGDATPPLDPDSGAATLSVYAGTPLVDGAGASLAGLDFNGDGSFDLAIGAPDASIADADTGLYTEFGNRVGRTYMLFGGDEASTDWQTLTGDYALTDLYGTNASAPNRALDGIVFEGTQNGGQLGAALSNIGFFRGNADSTAEHGIDDLAIGATGVASGEGQVYAAFGSYINYGDLGSGSNVFKVEPKADLSQAGTLPIFTYQSSPDTVNPSAIQSPSGLGTAVSGPGNLNDDSFSLGGSELVFGAPGSDVDGVSKAYVALGHPWLQPGDSLHVEDLRSDNGFITDVAGRTHTVDDFNGDGYGDFVQYTNDRGLVVTLGASTFDIAAARNREVVLETYDGTIGFVAAGDYDADGETDISAVIQQGETRFLAIWTADGLAAAGDTLAPTFLLTAPDDAYITVPGIATGPQATNPENSQAYSGDFNGDGYDDIAFSTGVDIETDDTAVDFGQQVIAYSTSVPGEFDFVNLPVTFDFEDTAQEQIALDFGIGGVADLNGDGRDELVVARFAQNNLHIWGWDDDTQAVVEQREVDRAGAGFAMTFPGWYSAPTVGDVNGDGYEDIVNVIVGSLPGPLGLPTGNWNQGVIIFGGEDYQSAAVAITPVDSGQSDFGYESYHHQASIVGDINQDGYDDILVSQNNSDQYAYVIYGAADLAERDTIELPITANAGSFEDGFPIEGLANRNHQYDVGTGRDMNGDGRADLVFSDRLDLGTTTVVYGERRTTDSGTTYVEGTKDDDILIQTSDGNSAVNIIAGDGDDFVQTLNGYEVYVFMGAGDDQVSLGSISATSIGALDGGTGQNTLALNAARIGQLNTLDLTAVNARNKVTNFQIVELGTLNGLSFDIPSLKALLGSGERLILNGRESQAKPIVSNDDFGTWSLNPVAEGSFDGKIYEIHSYKLNDGSEAAYSVWLEKGGVTWDPLPLDSTSLADGEGVLGSGEGDTLRGTRADDILAGFEGDDNLLLRWGRDEATGGAGADKFVMDARYLDDGDVYTIDDFDPSEGDVIIFRNFDEKREIRSIEDLAYYLDYGFAETREVSDTALSVTFSDLKTNFGSADETFIGTYADDVFEGGNGADRFLLRFGNDSATGGNGPDEFIFDARYAGSGSTHRVTDLDFDGGDSLKLRFFDTGKVTVDDVEELLALGEKEYASIASDETSTRLVVTNTVNEEMQIDLFLTGLG